MAEVYLAEQVSLRRQVALKVLLPGLAQDPGYLRRFHHEAQSAAALVHANIVQIYEVGCIDGVHFISQEYVAGQNLKLFIARKGPLDVLAAVNVMRQVAAGLHRAGQRGVVHRDIKPENILISPGGDVKVADFGLARVFHQTSDLTQIGVTMGTPLYMSPEQIEGNEVDPRSDIYSFGVTCYQMLSGRPPFDGETPLSIAVQHLKKAPERLENLRPDAPEGLCRIVHKMLGKAPQDRYQNAGEILRDIRALRLEGSDAEWAAAFDDWSAPELAALSSARMEATQQLDSLMKTAARTKISYRRYAAPGVLAVAAALMIGGAAAWALRPDYLLQYDPAQLPPVQKLESAQAQLFHARWVHTPSAYQAVEKYYPNESYYVHQAWRSLAKLHLQEDQLDSAMTLFRRLAQLPETETHFRAFGLAGQLAVHMRRGEASLAAAKNRELQPILPELHDPDLLEFVREFARNQEARLQRESEPIQSAE